MHKTTVYLDAELKRALERTAAETRRSEAELIREGIRRVVESAEPPVPQTGIFDGGDPALSEKMDELLAGFGDR